jgi:hypothetical protein
MAKKIIIIMLIGIFFHAHAMELSKIKSDICYLAMLPLDLQNIIAAFVMNDYETQEEFIARTQIKRALIESNDHDHYIENDQLVQKNLTTVKQQYHKVTWRLEPHNGTKILLIRLLSIKKNNVTNNVLRLVVVDKEKNKVMHRAIENIDRLYNKFALSPSGNIVASIIRKKNQYDYDNTIGSFYHQLKIKNLATKKSKNFEFAAHLNSINAFEFNKQGTCLIIRGGQYLVVNKDDVYAYRLFSLKNKKDITKNPIIPFEKTLQYYFKEKGVCKSITSGR